MGDIESRWKRWMNCEEGDSKALKQDYHLRKEGFPRGKKAGENSLITPTEAC